jgi:hypothetical protein
MRRPCAPSAKCAPETGVFVYHSGGVSGVVGLASVRSEPRDDPKNPKSAVVNLEYRGPHQRPIIETCPTAGPAFDDGGAGKSL